MKKIRSDIIEDKKYYSKVVADLVNYREYRQRCKIIEQELDSMIQSDAGIDYSGINAKTNGISNKVENTALKRLNSGLREEYTDKKRLIRRVEIAVEGLDPVERFIIEKKYLKGRNEKDVNIYTHPDFNWGKNKYYDFKDEAVKKIARILGYNKE